MTHTTQVQTADLTMQLAGPDQPGEDYLAKLGRINNARSRAAEIVTADQPAPVDQDGWEHRFEIWQGGHPVTVLLRTFHSTLDEIEGRMLDEPDELEALRAEMQSEKHWLREGLSKLEVPTALIEACLEPSPVSDSDETIWMTPSEVAAALESTLRTQWEALPTEVRETAWDAPSDGADYYQATQRVLQGQPRF